jgi:hypothetical protein
MYRIHRGAFWRFTIYFSSISGAQAFAYWLIYQVCKRMRTQWFQFWLGCIAPTAVPVKLYTYIYCCAITKLHARIHMQHHDAGICVLTFTNLGYYTLTPVILRASVIASVKTSV